MRGASRALAAAAVIVVVILLAVVVPRLQAFEQYLGGFWAADPAFLSESGLSEMYLYVAPGGGRRRQAHLVMAGPGGAEVTNQGVEITLGRSLWGALRGAGLGAGSLFRVPAALAFDSEEVMPTALSLSLNVAEGTLALYGSGKMYAFLVRDNEASLAANAEYAAGAPSPADG